MKYKELSCFFVLGFLITLFSLDIGMFWDNVLYGSKLGNHLFQHGVFNWNSIPASIDNGHPPFLATLIAIGWNLFGKSLAITHWIMLPFVVGLLYQLYHFVCFFIKEKLIKLAAFIFILADPTLLSQLVLVNPEIIQLFFFFLALNAILRDQTVLKIIGITFLGIITFRGMMLCAGLFFIDLLIYSLIKKQKIKHFFSGKIIFTYLISSIPAVLYIIWRLATKGWLISHPLEIWGNAMEFSSITDFLKNFGRNILVLGHQFTDFGRLIIILFILVTFYIKRKKIQSKKYRYLLIISIFSTIFIYGTSLVIRNTMGHRYYIVSFLSLALLAFMLIKQYQNQKMIYSILLVSLLSGNLIVYSDSFAQGWCSSLAHLAYWDLRHKAIEYMDKKNIPISKTASFFPNSTSIDHVDLNGDERSFKGFKGSETYVFYFNVYNLSDSDLQELNEKYYILKTFEKNRVRVEIMEKIKK